MRTPYGQECPYFYGDYYRGKDREECRLVGYNPDRKNWNSNLCKTCPVPGIILANACKNMQLHATIRSLPLGISRRIKVTAYCSLVNRAVSQPYIGCGKCHPVPEIFEDKKP